MTQNEFNVVLEQQYRKCADMLAHKKKEYTGDRIDRLNAFKIDSNSAFFWIIARNTSSSFPLQETAWPLPSSQNVVMPACIGYVLLLS